MTARYRAISQVAFRVERTAGAWREVVEIVREAATQPGYIGPSPGSVERIAAEIEATGQAVRTWQVATATTRRRRKLTARARQALIAAVQQAREGAG